MSVDVGTRVVVVVVVEGGGGSVVVVDVVGGVAVVRGVVATRGVVTAAAETTVSTGEPPRLQADHTSSVATRTVFFTPTANRNPH